MRTPMPNPPQEFEGLPDGPGHVPDPRLSRIVGLGLVGLFALLVLFALMGS